MRALIIVDVQNDFCPGGALAVREGDQVVAVINRLIEQGSYQQVVATQDWHPADHKSFASQHPGLRPGAVVDLNGLSQVLWPDHCVQGSAGAEFRDDLAAGATQTVFRKGQNPGVDSYSGFFDNGRRHSTGLGDFLKARGITSVDVCGLATDYCVRFTALDAVSLDLNTRLVLDATRGVELNPGDVAAAINAMREAGVSISTSEEVLS